MNISDTLSCFSIFKQKVFDQPVLNGFVKAQELWYSDPDLRIILIFLNNLPVSAYPVDLHLQEIIFQPQNLRRMAKIFLQTGIIMCLQFRQ